MTDLLTPEVIEWAEASGFGFMDRDGERSAVRIGPNYSEWRQEPSAMLAGGQLIIQNPEGKFEWQLRMEMFYHRMANNTLLYYYAPVPSNVEVKEREE